jgi:hypothetical protein
MNANIPSGLIALLTACLSGCAGSFNGVLNDSGEQVSFSRYPGLCLDSVMVTLPDGETFIGFLGGEAEPDGDCKIASEPRAPYPYSVLYGSRINMMVCDYRAAQDKPDQAGLCKVSDGRTIALKGAPDN